LSHEECPASPWGAVKLARRGKAVRNSESAAAEMKGVSWQLKGVPESKGAAFARPLPVKFVGMKSSPGTGYLAFPKRRGDSVRVRCVGTGMESPKLRTGEAWGHSLMRSG
jgi:hypothetical protein